LRHSVHFRGLLLPDGILRCACAKLTLGPNVAFSYIGSVIVWHSSSGRQPNCAAWYNELMELRNFCRGCHLYIYSAGRPSRWASAHNLVMVALWNRADHYIFALWFLLSSSFFFSSPNLSRRRLDVCHTSTHGVDLVRISDAGLKRAARGSLKIQDAKKSPKIAIAQLCRAISSQLGHVSTIRKKTC